MFIGLSKSLRLRRKCLYWLIPSEREMYKVSFITQHTLALGHAVKKGSFTDCFRARISWVSTYTGGQIPPPPLAIPLHLNGTNHLCWQLQFYSTYTNRFITSSQKLWRQLAAMCVCRELPQELCCPLLDLALGTLAIESCELHISLP